jgi:DNA primase
MRFPPHILDDIRSRLPVSAVVGRRVKLTKAGREWKGLSPFNAERTPSFFVNDQKGQYFDFSSGKNGDIFTFVMETEGLSFPDAVERLAGEAGVDLPRVSEETVQQEKQRQSLHEVCELAAVFFETELRGPRGGEARRYLQGRDLVGDVAKHFRLGYSPNERHALRDHLAGKGVPLDLMIEAGLLVHGDDIPFPYDRFRNRVMFPIADAKGRVIAFGGRALEKDVPAKYLNSPETPLFHKGSVVYNHHNARKAAHEAGTVIAVEGYVDVIAMTMAGLPHAVAPLGTALTEDQVNLLWRMAPEPILCFDGDKAGRRAAYRAVDVVLPVLQPGKAMRFAFLPDGQDPDDMLRASGPEAVRRAAAKTLPMIDVLWLRESERQPLDTPERRADFERRLKDCAQQIRDETLRKYYRSEIEERLRAAMQSSRQAGPGRRGAVPRPGYRASMQRGGQRSGLPGMPQPGEAALMRMATETGLSAALRDSAVFAGPGERTPPREAAILMALLNHPLLAESTAEELAMLTFSSPEARRLAGAILDALADGEPLTVETACERGFDATIERILRAQHGDRFWTDAQAPRSLAEPSLKDALALQIRLDHLNKALSAAERDFAETGSDASFEDMKAIRQRITALEAAASAED